MSTEHPPSPAPLHPAPPSDRPYFWVFHEETKKPVSGILLYWEQWVKGESKGSPIGISGGNGNVRQIFRLDPGHSDNGLGNLLIRHASEDESVDVTPDVTCELEFPDGKRIPGRRFGRFWEVKNLYWHVMVGKTMRVWIK